MAERSKAPDLSSGTRMSAWVRTPLLTNCVLILFFLNFVNLSSLYLLRLLQIFSLSSEIVHGMVIGIMSIMSSTPVFWQSTCQVS